MQIVIDIPEDTYKRTKFYKEFRDLNDCVIVLKAIDHAIELPEHHGRLIDASRLMRVDHIILESQVDNAPTIIEADKESED